MVGLVFGNERSQPTSPTNFRSRPGMEVQAELRDHLLLGHTGQSQEVKGDLQEHSQPLP